MDFQSGNVVFCKIDEVLRFFERLRLTRKRIILVTGEGDLPCDAFKQWFLPANVAHWFSTNVTKDHPRVTALPLGLGSPASTTTLRGSEILHARHSGITRDGWLYVNFRIETNPSERRIPYEYFQKISKTSTWVTFAPPSERGDNGEFLRQLARHRFVLCPPGNGVDTHRMWEVLLAGAIPVVKRSSAMEPFRELPVLFVNDFREITRELLERALEKTKIPSLPLPLMTDLHWRGIIRSKQAEIHGNEMMEWREWIAKSAKYGAEMIFRRLGIGGRSK